MYCPYCKNTLIKTNGEYFCGNGNNYFSLNISNFFDSFNAKVVKVNKENLKKGMFYCVNCGTRMNEIKEMHECCPKCQFEINKQKYYEIIEINPHQHLLIDLNELYNLIIQKEFTNIKSIEPKQASQYSGYMDIYTDNFIGRITLNGNGFVDKEIISVDKSKQIFYNVSVYYDNHQFYQSVDDFISLLVNSSLMKIGEDNYG